MKSTNDPRGSAVRVSVALIAVCLVSQLFNSLAAAAQGETPPAKRPASSSTPDATARLPSAKSLEAWRASIRRTPAPKKGCFTAAYPATEWKEVPCVTPPGLPYPPRRRGQPQIIGGTMLGDVAAVVIPQITSATGSFDSATVSSETGTTFGPNCAVLNTSASDTFSLQLNSGFFTTAACPVGSSGCFGWQQFVYSNAGYGFIQYWLGSYGAACPSGWTPDGGGDCYFTTQGVPVTPQLATNLAQITLQGTAAAGGDTVTVTVGGLAHASTPQSPNPFLNLSLGWTTVEFNVLGDACASRANFGTGTTIVGRTSIVDGSQKKPTCTVVKNTGETNNLNWGPGAPSPSGAPPALLFNESSSGGAASGCAAATSVGDTHLATFDGLLYDFQASGDFLLVHADKGFTVQTRQVSGAPSWPNAATNTAVAAKMGETRVAICLNPTRLEVDGKPNQLADGKSLSLPGGVDILHNGNVYYIVGESGDSVQATLNDNGQNRWIDVAVGLGHSPQTNLSGLLSNATGNVHAIEKKNGAVLNLPVSFNDLYHSYADSWRVAPAESLLCEDHKIEGGIPSKPLYARDLNPLQAKHARAICLSAGVRSKGLLEACTLDVAVLGNKDPAKVFVAKLAPVAVMPPPVVREHPEGEH
jgi:hypothetical protein